MGSTLSKFKCNASADPAPTAVVQLIAPVQAVDWVQVLRP